ncbi:MAG: hypothetical protein DRQ56_09740, partial [Gammaproteobacteria bacterium]
MRSVKFIENEVKFRKKGLIMAVRMTVPSRDLYIERGIKTGGDKTYYLIIWGKCSTRKTERPVYMG